jgi:hypothetical protein
MGQSKRIRRGAAVWRQLFSRQSSSGLSVPGFCRREGVNANLFRCQRPYFVALRTFIDGTVPSLMALGARNSGQHRAR